MSAKDDAESFLKSLREKSGDSDTFSKGDLVELRHPMNSWDDQEDPYPFQAVILDVENTMTKNTVTMFSKDGFIAVPKEEIIPIDMRNDADEASLDAKKKNWPVILCEEQVFCVHPRWLRKVEDE